MTDLLGGQGRGSKAIVEQGPRLFEGNPPPKKVLAARSIQNHLPPACILPKAMSRRFEAKALCFAAIAFSSYTVVTLMLKDGCSSDAGIVSRETRAGTRIVKLDASATC
ncbi:unnamed protein product [Sphagnum balticum]